MTDLTGCSAFSASKCHLRNTNIIKPGIIEEIKEVRNTQECQFYCRSVYGETCKYFTHHTKTKTCYIFNTFDIDYHCAQNSGGKLPNVKTCDSIFFDQIDLHTCSVNLHNILLMYSFKFYKSSN